MGSPFSAAQKEAAIENANMYIRKGHTLRKACDLAAADSRAASAYLTPFGQPKSPTAQTIGWWIRLARKKKQPVVKSSRRVRTAEEWLLIMAYVKGIAEQENVTHYAAEGLLCKRMPDPPHQITICKHRQRKNESGEFDDIKPDYTYAQKEQGEVMRSIIITSPSDLSSFEKSTKETVRQALRLGCTVRLAADARSAMIYEPKEDNTDGGIWTLSAKFSGIDEQTTARNLTKLTDRLLNQYGAHASRDWIRCYHPVYHKFGKISTCSEESHGRIAFFLHLVSDHDFPTVCPWCSTLGKPRTLSTSERYGQHLIGAHNVKSDGNPLYLGAERIEILRESRDVAPSDTAPDVASDPILTYTPPESLSSAVDDDGSTRDTQPASGDEQPPEGAQAPEPADIQTEPETSEPEPERSADAAQSAKPVTEVGTHLTLQEVDGPLDGEVLEAVVTFARTPAAADYQSMSGLELSGLVSLFQEHIAAIVQEMSHRVDNSGAALDLATESITSALSALNSVKGE